MLKIALIVLLALAQSPQNPAPNNCHRKANAQTFTPPYPPPCDAANYCRDRFAQRMRDAWYDACVAADAADQDEEDAEHVCKSDYEACTPHHSQACYTALVACIDLAREHHDDVIDEINDEYADAEIDQGVAYDTCATAVCD